MNLDQYCLFIGASILLCVVPGPDMMFLLGKTVTQGRRAGVVATLGINLGAYVHLAGAVLGITAVLASSAIAFQILKWAGALYLFYLAITLWFDQSPLPEPGKTAATQAQSRHAVFWQGFLIDVLNPKVALFYLSFLPQFVEPNARNVVGQLILLGVTLNVIALVINLVLVQLSNTVSSRLAIGSSLKTLVQRSMGTLFLYLGIRLVLEER